MENIKKLYPAGSISMDVPTKIGSGKLVDSRGFTLMEALVALAIFSIGILAVGGMQVGSVNQNAAAGMQTEATNLAVEWIERLKVLPYDHPDLDDSNSPQQTQYGSYTIVWQVVEALDMPLKTITVTVSSANPNARDVSLSTIKADDS